MKYYIIAGELSGDLHASYLIKELKKQDKDAVFRGFGGDKMKQAGCQIAKHINELAFMGFVQVLTHIRAVLGNIKACKKDILAYQPDVVIFIDYPGFNLRIAQWTNQQRIKAFYYISPTVWAWKKSRMKQINRTTERLYVILPFEKAFYARHRFGVEYFGSPLIEEIADFRNAKASNDKSQWDYNTEEWSFDTAKASAAAPKGYVVLLPGSRKQEIKDMLPMMLRLADNYQQFHFIIAGVSNLEPSFYDKIIGERNVEVVYNQTYNLLSQAQAAIVTSGTATLETALFRVPQVVCYKADAISYRIARSLANVKYISLVNLILDKPAVTELIQNDFSYERLADEFELIAYDNDNRERMKADYDTIISLLGQTDASSKIAEHMSALLKH
ncbi:MAG: lipid-A-disaccharide synthase [Bacteroidales bacterium]|jgi:lipid-A-disaccharide synthase|nr:lipid-A-disaccharide synthase [Bacteroidales bacterium]